MRKEYIQPAFQMSNIMFESLILAGSNGGYNLQSNSLGIGMGGESGTQIPQ